MQIGEIEILSGQEDGIALFVRADLEGGVQAVDEDHAAREGLPRGQAQEALQRRAVQELELVFQAPAE